MELSGCREPLCRTDRNEKCLIGNGAASRIPEIEAALHEFVIRRPFAKGPGFNGKLVAEPMDDENRLRMDDF